jgi:hypothetical protein
LESGSARLKRLFAEQMFENYGITYVLRERPKLHRRMAR